MAREISVNMTVSDEQYARLEKLLPAWQNSTMEGKKPFENMTVEKLFEMIMLTGSAKWIDDKIWLEEYKREAGYAPYGDA